MNRENSDFLLGMLTATIIIGILVFVKETICCKIENDIENSKTEHLVVKYKNSMQGIINKEMLEELAKQNFPSSRWEHVSSTAEKETAEFEAWNTGK